MIETLLPIIIGSVAGVLSFITCIAIWGIDLTNLFNKFTDQNISQYKSVLREEHPPIPPGSLLRLSIDIKQQELALTKEGTTVVGSYINIERNVDGMQTSQRVFLN